MSESAGDFSRRLDDEAAALADALLRGESPAASDEAQPLLDIAQRLNGLITPRTPPPAPFERHLRARLESEWAARPASHQPRRMQAALIWTLAAAAALVLVVLSIPESASFPLTLSGTAAIADVSGAMVSWRAVVLLLGASGLAAFWIYRLLR